MTHSHSDSSSKTTHKLFTGEWQNAVIFHVIYGGLLTAITTLVGYFCLIERISFLQQYGTQSTILMFAIVQFIMFKSIEETRTEVPSLSEVPVTINGRFTGKYAKQGSYVCLWPARLLFEEIISLQPRSLVTPNLQIESKDMLKLSGGSQTISYKVEEMRSVHFTKNTEENFIKELSGRLVSEINTIVSNAEYGDSGSTITSGLEQASKDLLKSTITDPHADPKQVETNDILLLAARSGVKINSINIAPFVPEDEEDKDALAQKTRQKRIMAGHTEKMAAFSQMVSDYIATHPNSSQDAAEAIVAAAMGIIPKQVIETSGKGGTGGATPVIVLPSTSATK